MAECYEQFNDILDSQHKDANTNARKNKAWETILNQHKAKFPNVSRTVHDLKTKLSKLKMEARAKPSSHLGGISRNGRMMLVI